MSIRSILEQFTGPYFVATVEGSEPRVRPFGVALEIEGRLYFAVGSQKAAYRQLNANPQAEVCTVDGSRHWLRVRGRAVFDDRAEVLERIWAQWPHLRAGYSLQDGPRLKPFYIEGGVAEVAGLDGSFASETL